MRKIICTAALAAFLLSGCGSGSTSVIELSPDVLAEAQAISPDNVYDLPELFFAGSALVYRDRYAVCEMVTQEFAAEVYDLKEGKVAGKLLHYGNGPQEVLVPIFNMFGDTLQVVDIQKNRLGHTQRRADVFLLRWREGSVRRIEDYVGRSGAGAGGCAS